MIWASPHYIGEEHVVRFMDDRKKGMSAFVPCRSAGHAKSVADAFNDTGWTSDSRNPRDTHSND